MKQCGDEECMKGSSGGGGGGGVGHQGAGI